MMARLGSMTRCPLHEDPVHSVEQASEGLRTPFFRVFSVTAACKNAAGERPAIRVCPLSVKTSEVEAQDALTGHIYRTLGTSPAQARVCEIQTPSLPSRSTWSVVLTPWGRKKGLSEASGLRARTKGEVRFWEGGGKIEGPGRPLPVPSDHVTWPQSLPPCGLSSDP